jgi:hypothetical protein
MSDSNQASTIELIAQLAEADRVEQDRVNRMKAATTPVRLRLDPIELLNQVQKMREDGVEEATIRAAFEQAIEQVQGKPRKSHNSMKAHKDAPKMPTQNEINRIYVDRYAHGIDDTDIQNETVAAIVDAMKASAEARKALPQKPPLRVRVASYLVRKVLGACIMFCKAFGVK